MTGFFPTNQNTLYLLCLFHSDNFIITVRGRPAFCTLIGWFKSSCLFISLSVSVHWHIQHSNINQISIYMFAQSLAATVCDGQNMMTLARSLYNTSINPNGAGEHIVPTLFLDACFSLKLKCWRAQIS